VTAVLLGDQAADALTYWAFDEITGVSGIVMSSNLDITTKAGIKAVRIS
jgi:hypothetical protein